MKYKNTRIGLLLLSLFTTGKLSAQCPYDNQGYLTGAAPTTVGATITAQQTWGGDFNIVTGMQAGYTYEISTCNTPTFDSELTIYPAGGGTAVAHDDDGCGIFSGPSKIIFTPAVSGDYDILLDEYGCLDNSIDMDMSITLIATNGGGNPGAINIAVVVHVVYKNATENVSDAQIISQIDALNRDYRKLNVDYNNLPGVFQPLGADLDITFCLASFDPNGNPTTGITRTPTSILGFSHNTEPKSSANGGHDNWDPEHYLNIWVCDLTGGLLGYATFPSGLTTSPGLDGVVIDYSYFGTMGTATAPFDQGRTATHEVGHWLNLRHIWGDASCGDDFVNDTPVQEQANTGCPNFPHVSCNNGTNGDLFYNYMDYTDDACLLMFTQGQKTRTNSTLALLRTGLSTAGGCGTVNGTPEQQASFSLTLAPNPAENTTTVKVTGDNSKSYTLKIVDFLGAGIGSFEKTIPANETVQLDLTKLARGLYLVKVSNGLQVHLSKLLVQ